MLFLLACVAPPDPPEVTILPDLGTTPPEDIPTTPPAEPGLILNELQARNDSTWMAADTSFPDWVEFYNPTAEGLDLSAVVLAGESGTLWSGDGVLDAHTNLLVPVDRLDADGDFLTLSVDGMIRERIATGLMPADVSWARFPDGGDWQPTARPTPGQPDGNSPSATLDPSDALFDTVTEFSLTIPTTSVASLNAAPSTEVPASLGFEGIWFPSVSVHLKGVYGSFRNLSQKAAFSVDLNEYEDHELRGLETLKFNNMVQDSTYIHEALAYRVFRAMGVPAPRTGWARLTVNDTYYGLYAFIEAEDDAFVRRWWADGSGNLYEGSYGVDFYASHVTSFECDECEHPEDRSDLQAVVDLLDQPATDANLALLEAIFDVDEFLTEQAVEALILHWDGYETANNYRIYHDPTSNQFAMIPWGTDQTFIDRWFTPYNGYGRLLGWCLGNPGARDRYDAILRDVADRFEALDLATVMAADLERLTADIATDPRKEWRPAQRQNDLATTLTTIEQGADWIRSYVGP